MKKHLAKLAVVAVALVGLLSAQSEAAVAVAHVHHGSVQAHCVVKGKHHHHKKMKVRKDKCMCHHKVRHHHGKHCVLHVCKAERRRHRH